VNLPSHDKIFDYWQKRNTLEFPDDGLCCFACHLGFENGLGLERCHVRAVADGGGADLWNMVLLCAECHKAAPMTNDSEILFSWIRNRETWAKKFWTEFMQGARDAGLLQGVGWGDGDLQRFMRFARHRKFAWHPKASRLQRYALITGLVAEYIRLRDEVFEAPV